MQRDPPPPNIQIDADGVLSEDGTLKINGGANEVAVVYFRAGYAPTDYSGPTEWDARLKIERSTAIKSPNIGYHLAGTKKVQQVLAQAGQVSAKTQVSCSIHRRLFGADFWLGGGRGEGGAIFRRCFDCG